MGYTIECGGTDASPGVGTGVSTLTGTRVLLLGTLGCCTLGTDCSSDGTSVSLSLLLHAARSISSRWVCSDVTCRCGPAVSCLPPEIVSG